MKLKYLFASCILGAGLLSSCADEFKDINSSEGDISTPNIRFLFTECLYQFEPMDYSAWYYDFRVLVLGDSVLLAQVVM